MAATTHAEYRIPHPPPSSQLEASWKTRLADPAHAYRVIFNTVSEAGMTSTTTVTVTTYDFNEADQTIVFTGHADSKHNGPQGRISAIIYLDRPEESFLLPVWI